MNKYNKYDVIYCEFPENDQSMQAGYRPAIVIQNNVGNKFSPTLLVIPLTKVIKNLNQPTHTVIACDENNGLKVDSMLLAEQTRTASKLTSRKIGKITDRELQKKIFRCFIYSAAYGDDDEDLKELRFA